MYRGAVAALSITDYKVFFVKIWNKGKSSVYLRTKNRRIMAQQVFSPYQMQILDSISLVNDEQEMRDIRNLIAEYFSNKVLDAMDQLCDDGKLSTSAIESWSSEHMRTPYSN